MPNRTLAMSSPVKHVCEHTSWYILVLTVTGAGGLPVLCGGTAAAAAAAGLLTGDDDDGDVAPAAAAAAAASAPCSMCFLLRLAARFKLGVFGGVTAAATAAVAMAAVLPATTEVARFSLDFLLRLGNVHANLSKGDDDDDLTVSYVLTNFLTVEIFDCLAAAFKSVFFDDDGGGGEFLLPVVDSK